VAQLYLPLIKRTIKGHLTWVFKHAQRPSKYWHRSYLVTGRPKDGPIFQLDQQCYPLLLLCDFLDQWPEDEGFVANLVSTGVILEILTVLQQKQDHRTGLFATEETPGDDPVEYPFHFSSQVLLWHTYTSLKRLNTKLKAGLHCTGHDFDAMAEALKGATVQHFLQTTEGCDAGIFAYLTDGSGGSKLYHDANDIPTLFAAVWGFCSTPLEVAAWRRTMEFGISAANSGGYYAGGMFEGLGSVHTPGAWPLGFFQMWRFGQLLGDRHREEVAWEKICGSMQWDGLFSEAVDQRGFVTSKAWFCWPGAMIGSGLLQDGVRQQYL
jgi:uncharacterized protein